MNNIALWIYLMEVADTLKITSEVIAMLSFIIVVGAFSVVVVATNDPPSKSDNRIPIGCTIASLLIFVIFCFITVFTPSSKTIAAMLIVPAITQNQHIQNIGDNGLKLIEGRMKEWLDTQMKTKGDK